MIRQSSVKKITFKLYIKTYPKLLHRSFYTFNYLLPKYKKGPLVEMDDISIKKK